MLIDHLIYAQPDLDAAVAEIEDSFGVRAAGGGQHPGRGTHNKVLGLGPRTYLEIIAPDPRQPEPSGPRPYGVEGITRGQLVGWAVACDDIEGAVERARSMGFDPGEVVDGQRVSATGTLLRWRVTRNANTAGLVPFLINWGDTPHPAVDATPGLVLSSVHVEHPEPRSLATALAAVGADVEVRQAPEPALVARINGPHGEQELR
ncbi:VOC family protein [Kribbella sp. NBC_01245]|uniref:VOC family protein n=1 Tax=Kribbella sp. NBC_01245 TaxID=2903578 RepID=UPI002E2A325A|nr:VOC family protein [Kribbella sp. NBC_01245]